MGISSKEALPREAALKETTPLSSSVSQSFVSTKFPPTFLIPNMSQPTNGNLTASYFRTVLDEETKKLKVLCQEWETFLASVTDPEALSEEGK